MSKERDRALVGALHPRWPVPNDILDEAIAEVNKTHPPEKPPPEESVSHALSVLGEIRALVGYLPQALPSDDDRDRNSALEHIIVQLRIERGRTLKLHDKFVMDDLDGPLEGVVTAPAATYYDFRSTVRAAMEDGSLRDVPLRFVRLPQEGDGKEGPRTVSRGTVPMKGQRWTRKSGVKGEASLPKLIDIVAINDLAGRELIVSYQRADGSEASCGHRWFTENYNFWGTTPSK